MKETKSNKIKLEYKEISLEELLTFLYPFTKVEDLSPTERERIDNYMGYLNDKIKNHNYKVYSWAYDGGFLAQGFGFEVRDSSGKVIEHKRLLVS